MNITTHGYLPIEVEGRWGFVRAALKDMSPAELAYITETRHINTLVNPGIERDKQWVAARDKLQASKEKA